jgi:TRAP-type mannitol/chloroaromatic compound transport system permease large subunit
VLTGLYAGYVFLVTIFIRNAAPALPPDATPAGGRRPRRATLAAGRGRLAASWRLPGAVDGLQCPRHLGGVDGGHRSLYVLASPTSAFSLGLLSKLAQQVIIVMMPPLALIFLVLGTIFLGIATPTEGGAMGAAGALLMALANRAADLACCARRWTRPRSCRPSWSSS